MVLSGAELIGSLQNEARILLHLAGKIDPEWLDYRPTPKQRSIIELLRYLSYMGPELIKAAKAGNFDPEVWTAAEQAGNARDLEQTLQTISGQTGEYASLLSEMSDGQYREEIEMFGQRMSRGAFLINMVLAGCAAYRMQLFLYLKSCGREELGTMNLWAGVDG